MLQNRQSYMVLSEPHLFEAFAKFLADLEGFDTNKLKYEKMVIREGHDATKSNVFFCYIGQNLLDHLATRTVANFLSGSQISDARFRFFCDRFITLYNQIPPDKQLQFVPLKGAFDSWKHEIFRKNGWSTDESKEFNLDKKTNDEVDSENDETELVSALKNVQKYYQKSSLTIERNQFYDLFKLVSNRLNRAGLPNESKNSDVVTVRDSFINPTWEWYERCNETILKREVNFAYSPPLNMKGISPFREHHYLTCLVEHNDSSLPADRNLFSTTFDLDYKHIFFKPVSLNSDKLEYAFFDFNLYYADMLVGTKFIYERGTERLSASLLVLRKSQIKKSTADLKFWNVRSNNEEIPPAVQAILVAPNEINVEAFQNITLAISQIFNTSNIF